MHNVSSNGANIPALGFGTFRMDARQVGNILPEALKMGFKHIDTAQIYKNEDAIGSALKLSGFPRQEIFLTTKVWVTEFSADRFGRSVERSLRLLQTDYVDLLLLHWPGGSDVPREIQIAELNRARTRGLTRYIGVSNYTTAQMEEATALSSAPLSNNQIEYHPWLSQSKVIGAARNLDISVTAYYVMAKGRSAQDTMLQDIGSRYNKSAAQVALRWAIQQPNIAALSKTTSTERLRENSAILDFELSQLEMEAISGLACPDGRIASPSNLAPEWD